MSNLNHKTNKWGVQSIYFFEMAKFIEITQYSTRPIQNRADKYNNIATAGKTKGMLPSKLTNNKLPMKHQCPKHSFHWTYKKSETRGTKKALHQKPQQTYAKTHLANLYCPITDSKQSTTPNPADHQSNIKPVWRKTKMLVIHFLQVKLIRHIWLRRTC